MDLVFATHNAHKANEINLILGHPFRVQTLSDLGFFEEIEENGSTFQANAFLKASKAYEWSGKPSFADDSGLCVDALDGAPGVFSARYAGMQKNDSDNNEKLLQELQGKTNRNAKFITVICYIDATQTLFFDGVCEGEILTEPLGESGFGYDPIFIPADSQRSFAQMSAMEKSKISHRAVAMGKFIDFLKQNVANP